MLRYISLCFCLLTTAAGAQTKAQDISFRSPMDIPLYLSGNFGEFRSNHFHSGIDFKTQGVVGKPVYAVYDGYISRVLVSPWGFGKALYMTHPNGATTVYGHIKAFSKEVEAYIREQQYKRESFSVDLILPASLFPAKKGDLIALSGNEGSSGGPHLHFEIRDTETEETIDPVLFFRNRIKDTRAPILQGMMVYPLENKGIVNGNTQKQPVKLIKSKSGKQTMAGKIEAWGEIGFAIKACDYMTETSNIYGVKEVILTADDEIIFHSNLDRYAFPETRYINSLTDYVEWKQHRSSYTKSFVEPGNKLRFIESKNRGILKIKEERTYKLSYQLKDAYGNSTTFTFEVQGKKQDIPKVKKPEGTEQFSWTSDNRFGAKGVRLNIPRGNLYTDFNFSYSVKEDENAISATHTLHNTLVPLHKECEISIKLQQDTLANKRQYGMVFLNKGHRTWKGGTYRNGWVDANVRELGTYTLMMDTVPPKIIPVNPGQWASKRAIAFRVSDNLSGMDSYRGEIDNKFALFEHDGSRGLITYKFDPKRLSRGKHKLSFIVTDACGNTREYNNTFVW